MAREKKSQPQPEAAADSVPFMTWFVGALDTKQGLKADHMSAVKTYFEALGLKADEPQAKFDEALRKYGIN